MVKKIYEQYLPPGTDVYLIRHDESEAQTNPAKASKLPDHIIKLDRYSTEKIDACTALLQAEFKGYEGKIVKKRSPYFRAIATDKQICNAIQNFEWLDLGEDISLREIEFGLNDGMSLDARKRRAKTNRFFATLQVYQNKHYTKEAQDGGAQLFSRHPHGESYAVVYDRVKSSLIATGNTLREIDENKLVVFGHGGTNRMAASIVCGMSAQEVSKLRNPDNCEIWKIVIPNNLYERPVLTSLTFPDRPIFDPQIARTVDHAAIVSPYK